MKKGGKIVKYISFFGILLVLLLVASYIFTPKNYNPYTVNKEISKGILGEETDSVDLVVLGDSETFVSIITTSFNENTGLNAFISGSTGQFLWNSYLRLVDILKTQHPKYLLLETNSFFTGQSILGASKNALVAEAEYAIPFFKYHDRWKYVLTVSDDLKGAHTDYNKGYRDVETQVPYEGGEYMFETDEREPMDTVSKFYLERIKKLCDENGIQLVLYDAPSPVNWNYKKHNTTADWAEANNVHFIDTNLAIDEMGIDWSTDTIDAGDHVNKYGAAKVTAYISDYFNKYILN